MHHSFGWVVREGVIVVAAAAAAVVVVVFEMKQQQPQCFLDYPILKIAVAMDFYPVVLEVNY
jgi:hypothetical protein